jgi:LuxR family maltose regulon positive regulatory protein
LVEPLTERELDVLRLIAQGLTNQEIADVLFISVNTVKTHAKHIYDKLNVRNRAQATIRATELDLL